jgi:uncharacterized protein with HEPN domain
MPERKPSAIIEDILECIEHIQSYTTGLSFEQFSSHFMTVEACLYNIQIIGEAVSLLPKDIKKENPGIKWAAIKGMRNRLIHEYFGTDLQLVWDVIKDELPELKSKLEKMNSELKK